MPPMGLERYGDAISERSFERTPRLEGADGPDPVDRSDGDFHRVHPIDAEPRRIGVDPALELTLELAREPLVAEDRCRSSKRQKLMSPTELPRDLCIAGIGKPRDFEILIEGGRWPAVTAFEVAMPVDVRPDRDWSRAEIVDESAENHLRLRAQTLRSRLQFLRQLVRAR